MKLCDYCKRKPAAFRLKHPETARHWRCLGCFRHMSRPNVVLVTGVALNGVVQREHDIPTPAEASGLRVAVGETP